MKSSRVREFMRTGQWPERPQTLDARRMKRELRAGKLLSVEEAEKLLRENEELKRENDNLRGAFRALCEATNHDEGWPPEDGDGWPGWHDCAAAMIDGECFICGTRYDRKAADVPRSELLPHFEPKGGRES